MRSIMKFLCVSVGGALNSIKTSMRAELLIMGGTVSEAWIKTLMRAELLTMGGTIGGAWIKTLIKVFYFYFLFE